MPSVDVLSLRFTIDLGFEGNEKGWGYLMENSEVFELRTAESANRTFGDDYRGSEIFLPSRKH